MKRSTRSARRTFCSFGIYAIRRSTADCFNFCRKRCAGIQNQMWKKEKLYDVRCAAQIISERMVGKRTWVGKIFPKQSVREIYRNARGPSSVISADFNFLCYKERPRTASKNVCAALRSPHYFLVLDYRFWIPALRFRQKLKQSAVERRNA